MLNPDQPRIQFRKKAPVLLEDGSLIQTILYSLDCRSHEYEATGEDVPDLERDWAFKYLELLD